MPLKSVSGEFVLLNFGYDGKSQEEPKSKPLRNFNISIVNNI